MGTGSTIPRLIKLWQGVTGIQSFVTSHPGNQADCIIIQIQEHKEVTMFKKLLKSLIVLGVFVGLVYAANDIYTVGSASAVTGDWNIFVADSFTTHVDSGKTVIEFAEPIYNLYITSLNAASDSGYLSVEVNDVVKLPRYTDGGSGHTTSPYATYTVGDNSEADTLKLHMGVRKITMTPTAGGTADSTVLLKLWGTYK